MSLDINKRWTFTSTGSGEREPGHTCSEWTFYMETKANSTGTIFLMTAQSTNSSSVGVIIGSTAGYNLGASETQVAKFTGPFAAVWPRLADSTAATLITVRAVAVG